jgi:Restriction endonuclease
MGEWSDYEHRVAQHFRNRGMQANVGVRLPTARGAAAVDVAIRFIQDGLEHLWIAECKYWNRRVGAKEVQALRTLASDVGAERAFLVTEGGFQSGAGRAAQFSNVTLTSLVDLIADFGRSTIDRPFGHSGAGVQTWTIPPTRPIPYADLVDFIETNYCPLGEVATCQAMKELPWEDARTLETFTWQGADATCVEVDARRSAGYQLTSAERLDVDNSREIGIRVTPRIEMESGWGGNQDTGEPWVVFNTGFGRLLAALDEWRDLVLAGRVFIMPILLVRQSSPYPDGGEYKILDCSWVQSFQSSVD